MGGRLIGQRLDCTRAVEAFLKKTTIAYRQNLVLFLEFRWYAIVVFFKNASISRVLGTRLGVASYIQQGSLGESMLRYYKMAMMGMKGTGGSGRSCGTTVAFTPRRFGAHFLGPIIGVLSPGVDSGVCNAFLRGETGGSTRNLALRGRFSTLGSTSPREMFLDRTRVVLQVNLF